MNAVNRCIPESTGLPQRTSIRQQGNTIITETTYPNNSINSGKGNRVIVNLTTGATQNWVQDSLGLRQGKTDPNGFYLRSTDCTPPQERQALLKKLNSAVPCKK